MSRIIAHFLLTRMLHSSICEFLRSLVCLARCKTGKYVIKRTSKTNIRTLRLCALTRFLLSPFPIVSCSRCFDHCFRSFRSLHVWIHTLCLCVRFKYASFYPRLQSFQSLFGSLFSLVSIAVWIYFNRLQNTAALALNYFVFETFYSLPFLAFVSRPQGPFDLLPFLVAAFTGPLLVKSLNRLSTGYRPLS